MESAIRAGAFHPSFAALKRLALCLALVVAGCGPKALSAAEYAAKTKAIADEFDAYAESVTAELDHTDLRRLSRAERTKLFSGWERAHADKFESFGRRVDALKPPPGWEDVQQAHHNVYFGQAADSRRFADAIASGDKSQIQKVALESARNGLRLMDALAAAAAHHGQQIGASAQRMREELKAQIDADARGR